MSYEITNKMKVLALNFNGISVENFVYTRVKFPNHKIATDFINNKFKKHLDAIKKDMNINVEIKRFPEGKKEQDIVTITGLGEVAAVDLEKWNDILRFINKYTTDDATSDSALSGTILSLGDSLSKCEVKPTDVDEFIKQKFTNVNLVKKPDLIAEIITKYKLSEDEAEKKIKDWVARNGKDFCTYDEDINAYVIIK